MSDFENKRCNNGKGVHYSRIIASWIEANGLRYNLFDEDFKYWLESMGLNEDEVSDIRFLATNGRMECEINARRFMEENGIKPIFKRS